MVAFLDGAAIFNIAWFKSCDACAADIPVLVIKPIAVDASFISTPIKREELATFDRACSMLSTDALDTFAVWVNTAAACSADPILSPQTFIACCTTPAVVTKSAPEAVAACAIAGKIFLIVSRLAPFWAMTIIASAASCADNGKSLPILLATSARPSMSLDVPPATMAALLSEASKSPKPFTAFAPIAVVAAPAIVMPLPTFSSDPKILDPALPAFCVRPSTAEPAFCIVAK